MNDGVKEGVLELMQARGEVPGETVDEQLAFEYLDEGLVDSLAFVQLVIDLEERFGIRFEPADMQNDDFRTIGGVARAIERRLELRG